MPRLRYWLVKTEPQEYGWDDFARQASATWDGVRNYEARNHLRGMRAGDLVLFYHSGKQRAVVGIARVQREAFPDPTAPADDWSAVELEAVRALDRPVALATIKSRLRLRDLPLLRRPRLSVMPVSATHFRQILRLGGARR